jgi:hypothetical protein
MEQPVSAPREHAFGAWKLVRVVAALVATLWFLDAAKVSDGATLVVGAITFFVVWSVLALLGLAVRRPGTALWVAVVVLVGSLIVSGLAALPLKALLVIIILLLLFR